MWSSSQIIEVPTKISVFPLPFWRADVSVKLEIYGTSYTHTWGRINSALGMLAGCTPGQLENPILAGTSPLVPRWDHDLLPHHILTKRKTTCPAAAHFAHFPATGLLHFRSELQGFTGPQGLFRKSACQCKWSLRPSTEGVEITCSHIPYSRLQP